MAPSTASGSGRCADLLSGADMGVKLPALLEGNEPEVLGAGVVGGRPDDLAVDALFDDVRRPAGGAGDDEQRREHLLRYAHQVIRDRREPVEVGEQVLGLV